MRLMLAVVLLAPSPASAVELARVSVEAVAPAPGFVPTAATFAETPRLGLALTTVLPAASIAPPAPVYTAVQPTAFVTLARALPDARTFDGARFAASTPDPVKGGEHQTPTALKPALPAAPFWRRAVPNVLTYSNMGSGLASMALASDGRYLEAGLFILLANLFDALDGRAARALKVDNPLGIDLDSLADVVSFGAAPALLLLKAALLPAFGWWAFPVAAAFAAAGLYRLARFNVGAHAEKSAAVPPKSSDSFTGMPIPAGAGVIVAFVAALSVLPAALAGPLAAVVALLAAAAMISRLPYPAFKKGGPKALLVPGAVAVAVAGALTAAGLPALIPAALFGLYLLSGPAAALRR